MYDFLEVQGHPRAAGVRNFHTLRLTDDFIPMSRSSSLPASLEMTFMLEAGTDVIEVGVGLREDVLAEKLIVGRNTATGSQLALGRHRFPLPKSDPSLFYRFMLVPASAVMRLDGALQLPEWLAPDPRCARLRLPRLLLFGDGGKRAIVRWFANELCEVRETGLQAGC